MAFMIKDIIDRILILMLLTIPSQATNLDCYGRPFHCVNSTHFMICVDLGTGLSTTIDEVIIPCPSTTICKSTNHFECEFPVLVREIEVNIIPNNEAIESDVTTFMPLIPTSIPFEEYYNTLSTSTLSEIELKSSTTDYILAVDSITKTDTTKPDTTLTNKSAISSDAIAKSATATEASPGGIVKASADNNVIVNLDVISYDATTTKISQELPTTDDVFAIQVTDFPILDTNYNQINLPSTDTDTSVINAQTEGKFRYHFRESSVNATIPVISSNEHDTSTTVKPTLSTAQLESHVTVTRPDPSEYNLKPMDSKNLNIIRNTDSNHIPTPYETKTVINEFDNQDLSFINVYVDTPVSESTISNANKKNFINATFTDIITATLKANNDSLINDRQNSSDNLTIITVPSDNSHFTSKSISTVEFTVDFKDKENKSTTQNKNTKDNTITSTGDSTGKDDSVNPISFKTINVEINLAKTVKTNESRQDFFITNEMVELPVTKSFQESKGSQNLHITSTDVDTTDILRVSKYTNIVEDNATPNTIYNTDTNIVTNSFNTNLETSSTSMNVAHVAVDSKGSAVNVNVDILNKTLSQTENLGRNPKNLDRNTTNILVSTDYVNIEATTHTYVKNKSDTNSNTETSTININDAVQVNDVSTEPPVLEQTSTVVQVVEAKRDSKINVVIDLLNKTFSHIENLDYNPKYIVESTTNRLTSNERVISTDYVDIKASTQTYVENILDINNRTETSTIKSNGAVQRNDFLIYTPHSSVLEQTLTTVVPKDEVSATTVDSLNKISLQIENAVKNVSITLPTSPLLSSISTDATDISTIDITNQINDNTNLASNIAGNFIYKESPTVTTNMPSTAIRNSATDSKTIDSLSTFEKHTQVSPQNANKIIVIQPNEISFINNMEKIRMKGNTAPLDTSTSLLPTEIITSETPYTFPFYISTEKTEGFPVTIILNNDHTTDLPYQVTSSDASFAISDVLDISESTMKLDSDNSSIASLNSETTQNTNTHSTEIMNNITKEKESSLVDDNTTIEKTIMPTITVHADGTDIAKVVVSPAQNLVSANIFFGNNNKSLVNSDNITSNINTSIITQDSIKILDNNTDELLKSQSKAQVDSILFTMSFPLISSNAGSVEDIPTEVNIMPTTITTPVTDKFTVEATFSSAQNDVLNDRIVKNIYESSTKSNLIISNLNKNGVNSEISSTVSLNTTSEWSSELQISQSERPTTLDYGTVMPFNSPLSETVDKVNALTSHSDILLGTDSIVEATGINVNVSESDLLETPTLTLLPTADVQNGTGESIINSNAAIVPYPTDAGDAMTIVPMSAIISDTNSVLKENSINESPTLATVTEIHTDKTTYLSENIVLNAPNLFTPEKQNSAASNNNGIKEHFNSALHNQEITVNIAELSEVISNVNESNLHPNHKQLDSKFADKTLETTSNNNKITVIELPHSYLVQNESNTIHELPHVKLNPNNDSINVLKDSDIHRSGDKNSDENAAFTNNITIIEPSVNTLVENRIAVTTFKDDLIKELRGTTVISTSPSSLTEPAPTLSINTKIIKGSGKETTTQTDIIHFNKTNVESQIKTKSVESKFSQILAVTASLYEKSSKPDAYSQDFSSNTHLLQAVTTTSLDENEQRITSESPLGNTLQKFDNPASIVTEHLDESGFTQPIHSDIMIDKRKTTEPYDGISFNFSNVPKAQTTMTITDSRFLDSVPPYVTKVIESKQESQNLQPQPTSISELGTTIILEGTNHQETLNNDKATVGAVTNAGLATERIQTNLPKTTESSPVFSKIMNPEIDVKVITPSVGQQTWSYEAKISTEIRKQNMKSVYDSANTMQKSSAQTTNTLYNDREQVNSQSTLSISSSNLDEATDIIKTDVLVNNNNERIKAQGIISMLTKPPTYKTKQENTEIEHREAQEKPEMKEKNDLAATVSLTSSTLFLKNSTKADLLLKSENAHELEVVRSSSSSSKINTGEYTVNDTENAVFKQKTPMRELIENSTSSMNGGLTSNSKPQDQSKSTPRYLSHITSTFLGDTQSTEFPSLESTTLKSQTNKFSCKQKKRGRYADDRDCRTFYICVGNDHVVEGTCPVHTVFSEIRKQCIKNLSHCIRNNQFRCTTEGHFSDFLNDNVYYICVNHNVSSFIRFKLQCLNGYRLNKTSVQCVWNMKSEQSSSKSDSSKNNSDQRDQSVSVTKETKEETEKSENTFRCKKEGIFPDPSDCKRYFACTKTDSAYRQKWKKCDSGEIFHRDKKKCIDDDSYECN